MTNLKDVSQIHSILITKLDHLGDMIWATPAIAALRYKFPLAKIHILCTVAAEPILRLNPAVTSIIIYDKAIFPSQQSKKKWLHDLIGTPDLALCFDTRDEAILLAYLSGAPIRGGYYYKDRLFSTLKTWLRLTHKYVHPTMDKNPQHEVLNNLRLLERLDLLKIDELPTELLATNIYLSAEEKTAAQQIIESLQLTETPLIMYNIPNKTINQGWPRSHIIGIVREILSGIPDTHVLLVAGPGEEALLDSLKPELPKDCTPLSGLPFRTWAGLFPYCTLSLSRDAGAVHVSAAMGVPVVSIFEAEWQHMEPCWEAWNVLHRNVIRPASPTPENIDAHIEDVSRAVIDLWKKGSDVH